jgi:glutathione synthase
VRIAFFVNDIATEKPRYTTTLLASEALRRGHEVCYVAVGDFDYRPDHSVHIRGRYPARKTFRNFAQFLQSVQSDKARVEDIDVTDIDVLMLRNDPAADILERPWAEKIGIIFGQEAVRRGVLVLNDPGTLSQATNKLYFQSFPAAVRPKTLISKSRDQIRAFVTAHRGKVVLKPLQGSGGQSVFLVRNKGGSNLNQMIDAIARDGYVIAQAYLSAAEHGDIRLFLMNGVPLRHKAKYAAIRRVGAPGDLRSNMHAGGGAHKVDIGDAQLAIAELVRPKLVRDGMFLVGLDIVGDKLLEINVFSPGALHNAQVTQGVNFTGAVVEAIERKVDIVKTYPGVFSNTEVAVL